MKTLHELTKHESGAILYADGSILVGNWEGVSGIPREFAGTLIGLGEPLTARRCAVPHQIKRAMQEYERACDVAISRHGFRSWLVNGDTVVVVQDDWA